MTQQTEPAQSSESNRVDRSWLRALFAALVLVVAFAGGGLATCAYHALSPGERKLSASTTELRGTTAVVTAMQNLAVLETAAYHMERVIDLRNRQSHLFGLFESQDALLLVAAAEVLAGIDLRSLRDDDIQVDREQRAVHLVLPPPMVLSSHLDNQHTYVHSRATDALAVRTETLETRARQAAEQTLREAAIDAGILQRARINAVGTLTALMRSLGFVQVEIRFREE